MSATGTIFGSVSNIQIAEELEKLGHKVDRKIIVVKDAVKEVGSYKAIVNTRKITRMYAKKKANGILCFIVLFFPHNQLTANTMHPLKKMAGIKYDTGCPKS